MRTLPALSRKYILVTSTVESVGLLIVMVGAAAILLLWALGRLPPGAYPFRVIGFLVVLGCLFASRLQTLQEHEAMYRALAKARDQNQGEPLSRDCPRKGESAA